MLNKLKDNVRNILIPCLVLSALCGACTGLLIFVFKWLAGIVIDLSFYIYQTAQTDPLYVVILFLALILLGVLSYTIIKRVPSCRGGGIPTAVTYMRGFLSFNWVANAFTLMASALTTFLGGVPLGNEGPSVQMGCAIGHGTVKLFARKKKAWDRYIMTGGACAGFSVATGTFLSGMIFAFEEVHRRFSPLIFMAVVTSVTTSTIVMDVLCSLTGIESKLFHILLTQMPLSYVWTAIVIGLVTGFSAIAFTKLYKIVNTFIKKALQKYPLLLKVVCVFVITGICGLISTELIGSGHGIIEQIISGQNLAWYILLVYLLVRCVLLLFATQIGVTGGLFVPTLTFGAIIGELIASAFIGLQILPSEYKSLMIVISMSAFLASTSRIPLTAIAFSVEAFSGLSNIIPIALGVGIAYLVIMISGVASFSDTVIEHKIYNSRKDKKVLVIDVHMPAMEGAFVVGKEPRDILWPPSCAILSVDKEDIYDEVIHAGDRLHLRYKTINPEKTKEYLISLLGKPNEELDIEYVHQKDTHYSIPEQ
ncbi:MAG: hypothetical protein E7348_01925 [Clostridiales bacterium]|nr:hypothetical protein [Clostridiales bacterium]